MKLGEVIQFDSPKNKKDTQRSAKKLRLLFASTDIVILNQSHTIDCVDPPLFHPESKGLKPSEDISRFFKLSR